VWVVRVWAFGNIWDIEEAEALYHTATHCNTPVTGY